MAALPQFSHSPILGKNLAYITLDRPQLATFCRKHGIRKLSLFGSILREDFHPERSDVDVLVEFLPNAIPGFFGLVGMEQELTELVGRKVDLRTAQELSRYFRQAVLDEAVTQYEQVSETA